MQDRRSSVIEGSIVLYRDLNSTGFNKTKFKAGCLKARKAGCETFGKLYLEKSFTDHRKLWIP